MGPLTPAPIFSPGLQDTFSVDPLTRESPGGVSPCSSSPPRAHRDNVRLLELCGQALQEEKNLGDTDQMYRGLCRLTGYSPESLKRFALIRSRMQEEQALAQEGDATSIKPLLYLLLALGGRVALGLGATLLEHLVLPGQPRDPGTVADGDSGPKPGTLDPSARPSNIKIMGGSVLVGAGVLAALGAAYLFWRQASIRRPTRAACLLAAHITALALAIVQSFLFEWVLFNRPPEQQLLASIPGMFSAGIYAFTVPNSLTAAETQLGLVPLGTMEMRMELALVLTAISAALFTLVAALFSQRNVESYVKQPVAIAAIVFLAAGSGLSFSNARSWQARRNRGLDQKEVRQRKASISQQAQAELDRPGPRRPTALPAHLGRELAGLQRPQPPGPRAFSASQVHMMSAMGPAGEPESSTASVALTLNAMHSQDIVRQRTPLSGLEPTDYFNLKEV